MKPPNQQQPRVYLNFPVSLEINERTFILHAVDTRRLWKMYGRYEALLISIMPKEGFAGFDINGAATDEIIDLMIELCELCEEDGVGPISGHFDDRFLPGDHTPMELMEAVAGTLFGPFLTGGNQGRYQPLIMKIAQPLTRTI